MWAELHGTPFFACPCPSPGFLTLESEGVFFF